MLTRSWLRASRLGSTMLRNPLASMFGRRGFATKNEPKQPPYSELERDFLDPKDFYETLSQNGLNFYTGVPDSLLKDFCGYITDNVEPKNHIITANEGLALSLACGYQMSTGRFPVVYLQNSGLGNIVNPLMSLAHSQIYSIPMLLLIGWRGEPGKKDEPQHMIQGKVMNGLLTEMGIQYEVLPDYLEGAQKSVDAAIFHMKNRSSPYAFVIKRQTFLTYNLKNGVQVDQPYNREEALEVVLDQMGSHDIVVGTTGFMSRELYELRKKRKESHERDFLTVGSMGHASSIALGIAISKPSRTVYCLDGDGALLMHMGAIATVGSLKLSNFKHIVFNNGAHDSVGAQPTCAFDINMQDMAKSVGYVYAGRASTEEEITKCMEEVRKAKGPAFLEIRIRPGARVNLGRPKETPIQNKQQFMDFLRK